MQHKLVAFDIETAPTTDEKVIKQLAERIKAPANYKDEEKIEQYKREKLVEKVKETALNPTFGRVVAFAVYDGEQTISRTIVDFDGSERKLLDALATALANAYTTLSPKRGNFIVGHNIIGFDIPFVIRRGIINGSERVLKLVSSSLLPKPLEPAWRIEHVIDTMLAWGKPYARLKDIAGALDLLDGAEDDMDGGDTLEAFLAGNIDLVREHVENDVVISYRVAEKMMGVFW